MTDGLDQAESAVGKLWMLYFQRISFQIIRNRYDSLISFKSDPCHHAKCCNNAKCYKLQHFALNVESYKNEISTQNVVNFYDVFGPIGPLQ